jgi:SHS2 domain-containing protein
MMEKSLQSGPPQGFREVEHTADWELVVWASDLPGLIEQAARGMNALSGIHLDPNGNIERQLTVHAIDAESILVGFLQELLFIEETEGISFQEFDLHLQPEELTARLTGAKITSISKEIKAVTFHNLKIETTPYGLEARIVFDV